MCAIQTASNQQTAIKCAIKKASHQVTALNMWNINCKTRIDCTEFDMFCASHWEMSLNVCIKILIITRDGNKFV